MNASDWLQALAPSPGLLLVVIAAIALVESLAVVGLVVPGVVLMTAAASMAGHYALSIPVVLACAFLGAVIGDGVSFALGYTQRERIPATWPFDRHPEWLARGARFFQRYGVLSVLIGRFVGPVRPIVPMIAGMMHMSPVTFAWSNLGSALLWAPAYVLPGYLLGRTWEQFLALPPGSKRWLILLALTVTGLALTFSWLRHALTRGGWAYRRLAGFARRRGWRRRLWLALSLPAPQGEFPLASLMLLLTSLAGFSAWTLLILEQAGPLGVDHQLQAFIDALAGPLLSQWAAWTLEVGDALGAFALALPWLLWLLHQCRLAIVLHLLGGLGISMLLNELLPTLLMRTSDLSDLSYPSALVSTAVVFAGLVAAQIAEGLRARYRPLPYWLAILYGLAVAAACLVLDTAWLSGVIGGALLGLTICAIVRISYHYFMNRPPARLPWPMLCLASLLLILGRITGLPPL